MSYLLQISHFFLTNCDPERDIMTKSQQKYVSSNDRNSLRIVAWFCMTSQVEHALCQRPVRRALCMHYARVDAVVGFIGKWKKMEENILNLSFGVDTYEEEEGGDDIDSSDSDNNDRDLGELTLNADNAVAAAGAQYSGCLSPGLGPLAETAGRWMVKMYREEIKTCCGFTLITLWIVTKSKITP